MAYSALVQLFQKPPSDAEQLRRALRAFAASGVDLSAPTDHASGKTPFQIVAGTGLGDLGMRFEQSARLSFVALEELVSMGVDMEFAHPKTGARAIHYAAKYSTVPMIERLLELGVNPSALDDAGESALHYCLSRLDFDSGRLGVFCALLKGGADPTVRSPANKTLLQLVRGDDYKREVRSALLEWRIQSAFGASQDELKSSFRVTQRATSGPTLL